jgi:hypothetical protein
MAARSLFLVALLAASTIANPLAHAQTVTDPSGKTLPAIAAPQEVDSDSQPITAPPALPDIPPLLPGMPSPGLPHYNAPVAGPGQFAPAPNRGPVTGYGPGGMAPLPGAPANPPYSSGPLR